MVSESPRRCSAPPTAPDHVSFWPVPCILPASFVIQATPICAEYVRIPESVLTDLAHLVCGFWVLLPSTESMRNGFPERVGTVAACHEPWACASIQVCGAGTGRALRIAYHSRSQVPCEFPEAFSRRHGRRDISFRDAVIWDSDVYSHWEWLWVTSRAGRGGSP